jgi:hypothetical protein
MQHVGVCVKYFASELLATLGLVFTFKNPIEYFSGTQAFNLLTPPIMTRLNYGEEK